MDSKRSMQQCLTFINDAKREIESVGRQETNQTVKSEIDQAYKSLNDSWNHCNSALQKIM
jgi:hypothetical protein